MFDQYLDQVRLLIDVLPHVAQETAFALKGGTAINMFYRDMPRLSVDIDLTYVPVADRDSSLRDIDEILERIMAAIAARDPAYRVKRVAGGGNNDTRIMVQRGRTQIKLETSPVMRGTVRPPVTMMVAETIADEFGFAEMQVLDFEDLYAGKLSAALDRQHPRDLFDVKVLYENEGLTDDLLRALMVYVAGSCRPMHELLSPPATSLDPVFDREFVGMTRDPVTKEELQETRARLQADILGRLTGEMADFLLSLHDAAPDFERLGLPEAAALPAIRWKLINLEKLKRDDPDKHTEQREQLERLLSTS